MEEKIDELVNYIMKNCLWQFNSRAWDRVNQNEGILTKTEQILCEEPVEKDKPADRYYWVEAAYMVEMFKEHFKWICTMNKEELKELMQGLKDKIDYLTIKGSLNLELTDPLY